MLTKEQVVTALLLLPLTIGGVAADEREWIKTHSKVEIDDVLFAEYVRISTSDEASPHIERCLYRDAEGTLLVVRESVNFAPPGDVLSAQHSITMLDGGEELALTLEDDGTITATLGRASLHYGDQFPLPESTRDDALALLQTHASPGFRSALERLAEVGLYYAPVLLETGAGLRQLFFHEMKAALGLNHAKDVSDPVTEFDPNQNPPSEFERSFGTAYYE